MSDAAVSFLVEAGEAAWALEATGGSERAAANMLLDRGADIVDETEVMPSSSWKPRVPLPLPTWRRAAPLFPRTPEPLPRTPELPRPTRAPSTCRGSVGWALRQMTDGTPAPLTPSGWMPSTPPSPFFPAPASPQWPAPATPPLHFDRHSVTPERLPGNRPDSNRPSRPCGSRWRDNSRLWENPYANPSSSSSSNPQSRMTEERWRESSSDTSFSRSPRALVARSPVRGPRGISRSRSPLRHAPHTEESLPLFVPEFDTHMSPCGEALFSCGWEEPDLAENPGEAEETWPESPPFDADLDGDAASDPPDAEVQQVLASTLESVLDSPDVAPIDSEGDQVVPVDPEESEVPTEELELFSVFDSSSSESEHGFIHAGPATPEATQPPDPQPTEPSRAGSCVICMERAADFAIVPCGHRCLCQHCSYSLDRCPMCRGVLQGVLKIFDCVAP